MSRLSVILGVLIALVPLCGAAQQVGPQPMPSAAALGTPVGPPPAILTYPRPNLSEIRARMAQFESARLAARARMLAALTPAHKQLLSQVVGELAVGTNPDAEAATQRLDAALSPTESAAIVSIQRDLEREMAGNIESIPHRPVPVAPPAHWSFGGQDAGRILLRTVAMTIIAAPPMFIPPVM